MLINQPPSARKESDLRENSLKQKSIDKIVNVLLYNKKIKDSAEEPCVLIDER